MSHDQLRLYSSTDIIGVEIAGAMKNVISIGKFEYFSTNYGKTIRFILIY